MFYPIRKVVQDDIPQLEKMLNDYLRETYNDVWTGTAAQLKQNIFDSEFEMLVAENSKKMLVGFVAWNKTYDLHHCLKGATIIDFYVAPKNRGRGAGLLLIVEAAAQIQNCGGAFLHGGAVESEVVRRFYNRIARSFPNGESYVSGRAFRHLAELSGKNVREVVRNLPQTTWNYES